MKDSFGKKSYKSNHDYYGKICKVLHNFRIKNNMSFGEYTNNQVNLLERKETLEICRDELRKMLNCEGTSLNEIVSNSSCFEDDIKEKLIKRFILSPK